ncbi:tail fiber domain-containing protein [Streptomyces celluloflavus]|uniref:tail fiber domain-containing protein n=1 Tax=Streptomyces celluloflavus TaxID=58344 RepID=UPI00364AA156
MNLTRLIMRARRRRASVIHRTTEPVNGFDILDAVVALPVSTWRYRWEPEEVRHLGPMFQDWQAAFNLGDDYKGIYGVDANGVALVSIQALHRKCVELASSINELEKRLSDLSQARGHLNVH